MNGTLNTNLRNTSNVNKAYADIKSIKKELETLKNEVSDNTLNINSLNTNVSNIKTDISKQITTKNIATENISISNAAHALNSLTVDGELSADKITCKELIYDIQDDVTVENLTAKKLEANTITANTEEVNTLHVNKYLSIPEGTTLRKPYITNPYITSATLTGNTKITTSLPQYTKNIALGLDDENNLCKVLVKSDSSGETTDTFTDKSNLYGNLIGLAIEQKMAVFNKEIYYVTEDGKLYNSNNELIYTFVNKPEYSLMKYSENEAHFISQVDDKYNLYLFNIDTLTETLVAEDIVSISGVVYYTSYGQFYLTGTSGAYEIHYIGPEPEDDTLLRYLINESGSLFDIYALQGILLLSNNMIIVATDSELLLAEYDESIDPHIKQTSTSTYNIDISVALQGSATIDDNNAVAGAQLVLAGIGYTDGYNFVQDANTQYCKINDISFIMEKPTYSNKIHIKSSSGRYFIPSNTWAYNRITTYITTTKLGATVIEQVYYNSSNYQYLIYTLKNNYLKLTGSSIEYPAEIIQLGDKYLFNGELYDYIIYNSNYYYNGDTSVIQNGKVYLDVTDAGITGPSDSFTNCDVTFGNFDIDKRKFISNMTFTKCNIHNLLGFNMSFRSDTENNFDNCYITDSSSSTFSCNKFKNSYLNCNATTMKANEIENSNLIFSSSCTLTHMGTEYITSGALQVNVVNSILKNADTTNCNLVNCKEE